MQIGSLCKGGAQPAELVGQPAIPLLVESLILLTWAMNKMR